MIFMNTRMVKINLYFPPTNIHTNHSIKKSIKNRKKEKEKFKFSNLKLTIFMNKSNKIFKKFKENFFYLKKSSLSIKSINKYNNMIKF